ncbi:MAG: NAD-dependent epimerase/dehydratase family protein, partial [Saprospiraceae bacterium]|nr:NAD-dependent epimerase/dehydratase family protein [Saprospiraceae bacterium]
ILVHPPKRVYYDDDAHWGEIPSVESEIALINAYGAKVIALVLNTQGCSPEEAKAFQEDYYEKLKIPVLLPIEEGVNAILPAFLAL